MASTVSWQALNLCQWLLHSWLDTLSLYKLPYTLEIMSALSAWHVELPYTLKITSVLSNWHIQSLWTSLYSRDNFCTLSLTHRVSMNFHTHLISPLYSQLGRYKIYSTIHATFCTYNICHHTQHSTKWGVHTGLSSVQTSLYQSCTGPWTAPGPIRPIHSGPVQFLSIFGWFLDWFQSQSSILGQELENQTGLDFQTLEISDASKSSSVKLAGSQKRERDPDDSESSDSNKISSASCCHIMMLWDLWDLSHATWIISYVISGNFIYTFIVLPGWFHSTVW